MAACAVSQAVLAVVSAGAVPASSPGLLRAFLAVCLFKALAVRTSLQRRIGASVSCSDRRLASRPLLARRQRVNLIQQRLAALALRYRQGAVGRFHGGRGAVQHAGWRRSNHRRRERCILRGPGLRGKQPCTDQYAYLATNHLLQSETPGQRPDRIGRDGAPAGSASDPQWDGGWAGSAINGPCRCRCGPHDCAAVPA